MATKRLYCGVPHVLVDLKHRLTFSDDGQFLSVCLTRNYQAEELNVNVDQLDQASGLTVISLLKWQDVDAPVRVMCYKTTKDIYRMDGKDFSG